jgi:uncharacterized protein YihD (DUF1040 family)
MHTKKRIDEVLKSLKEYWNQHQELDFGQVLDSIKVRKGDTRDMSRLNSDELILYIEELLKEEKVFTKEQLATFRQNRYKEYHSSSSLKEAYSKEPVPLFLDGKFVKSNYFGGDDIIRNFFTEISESDEPIMFPEVSFDYDEKSYFVGITAMKLETAHFVTFAFCTSGLVLEQQNNKQIFHIGVFNFEKENLDNIQMAWFDGREMTENDYLLILNTLKATGFNFFSQKPKKLPKPTEEEEKKKKKNDGKKT